MVVSISGGDPGPNGGNWFQLVLAIVLFVLFAGMAIHHYVTRKNAASGASDIQDEDGITKPRQTSTNADLT